MLIYVVLYMFKANAAHQSLSFYATNIFTCLVKAGIGLVETVISHQSSEAEDDQHTQVCELEIENISSTVFIL